MRMRALMLGVVWAAVVWGQALDFRGSFTAPLDGAALRYSEPAKEDVVAKLAARLKSGDVKLEWDARFGYLPAVLKALGMPESSQTLVFSKTSFQLQRISPATPRALYFNDDAYVGYVPDGDVLELSAADPERGGMFYSLRQERVGQPAIERREECLQCHSSPLTTGVPGHFVRSVRTDKLGYALMNEGSFVTDHRSPWAERWGGWYVTGAPAGMKHMGRDAAKGFPTGRYLRAESDIAALMLLEHQTKMHNLLARAGFEARSALLVQAEMNAALQRPARELSETNARRLDHAAEIVVRYLLMADEVKLPAAVRASAEFVRAFEGQGPRDAAGRSLRELDLKTRLLKYPCSYLIYSEDFARLPGALRERILKRVDDVVSGRNQEPAYAALSAEDRKNVREILAATLKR